MALAIIKDIQKDYISAVHCYEAEILVSEKPQVDTFINLAFLYWEFATEEIEFNIPNGIPEEWGKIGVSRFTEILEMGLSKYPLNVELHFWNRYLRSRLFFDDFTYQDCELLIEKYGDNSLVPYFFLSLTETDKFKRELEMLAELCLENPTAKNNYIKTFLPID